MTKLEKYLTPVLLIVVISLIGYIGVVFHGMFETQHQDAKELINELKTQSNDNKTKVTEHEVKIGQLGEKVDKNGKDIEGLKTDVITLKNRR